MINYQATWASNEKNALFGSVQNARSRIENNVVLLRINYDVTTLRSVSLTAGDNVNKNIIFMQQSYIPKRGGSEMCQHKSDTSYISNLNELL